MDQLFLLSSISAVISGILFLIYCSEDLFICATAFTIFAWILKYQPDPHGKFIGAYMSVLAAFCESRYRKCEVIPNVNSLD